MTFTHMLAFSALAALAQESLFVAALADEPPDPRQPLSLNNAGGENASWTGIARIERHGGYACTATLLDTGSSPAADAPAYALTAGHCVTDANGTIEVDVPFEARLLFNYFADTQDAQISARATRVRWASRQGVDLAIVELDTPLAQLEAAGITPLPISRGRDTPDAVRFIGAPGDGYLMAATCAAGAVEQLIEQPWVMRNVLKSDCLQLRGGQSGSPLIDPRSGKVAGVISTTTSGVDAQWGCQEEDPCEVVAGQPVWSAQSNYASRIDHLTQCFANGRLDMSLPRCELLPAFALQPQPWRFSHSRVRLTADDSGQIVTPHWRFAFTLDKPHYRFKAADSATACADPVGYSGALSSHEAMIDTPVGSQPGVYFLCVVGVDSAQQVPERGLMRNAFAHATQLYAPGPTPTPVLAVSEDEASYRWVWPLDPPLINQYRVKHGPVDQVADCGEDGNWQPILFERAGPFAKLANVTRVCALALDGNGQPSEVLERLIGE